MKGIACGFIALGLLGISGASHAAKISPEPAATLLLPYFEVDLNNSMGVSTTFSLNNAYALPVFAHVTVWSDLSVPVLGFNVYLTGYDVQTIDLRGILVNGVLPQTFFPGGNCPGQFPPPPLQPFFIQHLQASLTGNASSIFGGRCAGQGFGDNIARGYITVDTVNYCTLLLPGDPGYFPNVATDDNVLWGDYFYVDPSQHTAAGNTLVHIPAETPAPFPGDYSFYGRYVAWTGLDKRRPLATSFATQFFIGSTVPRTDLIIWRDAKVSQQPFNCVGWPSWYPLGESGIAVFDDQENLFLVSPGTFPFPAAAQRVEVGGPNFPVPFNSGWINLNLNTASTVPPSDPAAAQAWVSVSVISGGSFEMGYDAIQIDNASNALHSVPP